MRITPYTTAAFIASLFSACAIQVDEHVAVRQPTAARQSTQPRATSGRLRFVYEQFPGAPGLLVKSVEPGRSADRAGIVPRDCIMAVGGRRLEPDVEPNAFFSAFAVGERVSVDIVRDGRALTLDAVLDAAPPVAWTAPELPVAVYTTSPVCMKRVR